MHNTKPILFNTDMVRSILEDRKTVTRRVVKPQPVAKLAYVCMGYKHGTWSYPGKDAWKYWEDESFRLPDGLPDAEKDRRWTPPCHTGDILYVRETWNYGYCDATDFEFRYNETFFEELKPGSMKDSFPFPRYFYRTEDLDSIVGMKWHPSIHMPREAARIFLRVTDVRVERLQEIDAPGILSKGTQSKTPEWLRTEFADLWNSTIKPTDIPLYGWDANPYVWVIEFERISKEEAQHGH